MVMTKSQMRRNARTYEGDIENCRIIVRRNIAPNGPKPGDDITEEAKQWKNIRMLLRKGFVECIPAVDHRTVEPKAAKTIKTKAKMKPKAEAAAVEVKAKPKKKKVLADDYDA